MLLYVLQSDGSSPGRQGFFMAVNATGDMAGSIGGGIMEHKFVEMARERLKDQSAEQASIKKQVHNKSASKNQSGMICSGEQSILIYRVQQEDMEAINRVIRCLSELNNASLQLSPAGLEFSTAIPPIDYEFSTTSEDNWLYKEKLGYKNHLHIIGAGHCALALSKMMSLMDFYIHLYDDRSDLNTFNQNEFVQEKLIVEDYSTLQEIIQPGDHEYIVVMTVGYRTDDIVVRALLNKEFRYFGLLGSKAKIDKMFADYKSEGISEALLNKIHAPIGLSIKSQTPEEIAISIAAEIIQVKNSP